MPIMPCVPTLLETPAGYLATTPLDHPYRIGVVGVTPEEAEHRFVAALAAWEELHERADDKADT